MSLRNHMELNIQTVRSKRRRRRRRHQSDKEIPELTSSKSSPLPAIYSRINMNEKYQFSIGSTWISARNLSFIEKVYFKKSSITTTKAITATTLATIARLKQKLRKSIQMNFSIAVIIAIFFANTSSVLSANLPCDKDSWWDSFKDRCILCTVCEGDMIPLRPCQIHRDTICGSIYDLKIDWVVLAKTEPNWKERRKIDAAAAYGMSALEQQLSNEELHQLHDDTTMPMDWQTATLFMAVLACLLFFIVAACILIHHMRQWRHMEKRLDQDVEELSTKLMAKLAEVQNLDGGTFFIGSSDALQMPTTFQAQHVLLPAEKSSKNLYNPHHIRQHEHRFLKTTQPGNVYIENASKA